jgi:hypothetical protein
MTASIAGYYKEMQSLMPLHNQYNVQQKFTLRLIRARARDYA